MTKDEIFSEMSTMWTRKAIVKCSNNDNKKPCEFLVDYLQDVYKINKPNAMIITDKLLNYFEL